ncbi:polysaccharide deacetylase family protein [Numidum massiliense]|uniref:polysaccharide deacetylase family protein n=1 Tax=Numidum massiliense TaxID=1522315 RepID=UPI0006D52EEE|nr:polysaccharide deacetylase family protein [Numidum massiliense]
MKRKTLLVVLSVLVGGGVLLYQQFGYSSTNRAASQGHSADKTGDNANKTVDSKTTVDDKYTYKSSKSVPVEGKDRAKQDSKAGDKPDVQQKEADETQSSGKQEKERGVTAERAKGSLSLTTGIVLPGVAEIKQKKGKKVAYLTFDDGPTPQSHEILDILKEFDAHATFFMLEPAMKEYPKAVKRMVEEGHAVGMHGVTHDQRAFYASVASVVGEMSAGRETIKKLTGVDTGLIRVPYGSYPHMTPVYKQAVASHGFTMWDWNVDSNDWRFRDGRFLETTIAQVNELEKKGETPVILLHDRAETVPHLRELLSFLKEKGYELEALDATVAPVQFVQ